MRIKTTVPIGSRQYEDQVRRFRTESDNLISHAFPIKTNNPKEAEIKIDIQSPIVIDGFKAVITYIQNYETEIEHNGNIIKNPQSKEMVKYRYELSYQETEAILDALEPVVDRKLKDIDKLRAKIAEAVMQDIVSKDTFGGLSRESYTIEF